jgi:hypothetical protein
MCPNG